jgi:hypothetical protein
LGLEAFSRVAASNLVNKTVGICHAGRRLVEECNVKSEAADEKAALPCFLQWISYPELKDY